ncbi:MAG: PQQ-binding-like beta-propeller repeat protein [Rubripirellula sp.]
MSFVRYFALPLVLVACSVAVADDWLRFRGPSGSGVATGSEKIPTQWSPRANIAWKTPLPGPGVSSPIVVGSKVFLTCYSGYGLTQESPGEIKNLMRHVVCVDAQTGEKLWQRDVRATLPEDPYSGVGVTAHGYASHTPVSDGKHVYAFLGKSGVHAFDLDGTPVWKADVGKESDPTKWGSSSSPIIHEDLVIVTASAESQSIIGLDKITGEEKWRQEAEGLDGMWGTPTLVKMDGGRTDLVMCVAKELWGLDPASGKMRWFAEATGAEHAYSSVITDGDQVLAFTGRGGGSIAVKMGGTGDVSDSNTVWTGNETASFGSPVRHQSKAYLVSRGVVTIVDTKSGEKLDQVRLQGVQQTGGRFGSLDYPSPIVVGDRMFYLNGSGQMFVFDLSGELEQVAVNRVTNDKESFGGTPAVSDGRLFLRSTKHLYCVTDKGETVQPSAIAIAKTEAPANPGRAAGGRPGGGQRGGGGGGNSRFDPMSLFASLDLNKDSKVTADELAKSPMKDRLKTLDKDGDDEVSQEEFRSGISTLFGGRSGGGGGGYRPGGEKDSRPDRPQRPQMAG